MTPMPIKDKTKQKATSKLHDAASQSQTHNTDDVMDKITEVKLLKHT